MTHLVDIRLYEDVRPNTLIVSARELPSRTIMIEEQEIPERMQGLNDGSLIGFSGEVYLLVRNSYLSTAQSKNPGEFITDLPSLANSNPSFVCPVHSRYFIEKKLNPSS